MSLEPSSRLTVFMLALRVMWLAKSVSFSDRASSRLMKGPRTVGPMPAPSSIAELRMPSSVTLDPLCRGSPLPSLVLFLSRTAPSASCLRLRSMASWMRALELPVPSSFSTLVGGV